MDVKKAGTLDFSGVSGLLWTALERLLVEAAGFEASTNDNSNMLTLRDLLRRNAGRSQSLGHLLVAKRTTADVVAEGGIELARLAWRVCGAFLGNG